jgi:hypothetical protein
MPSADFVRVNGLGIVFHSLIHLRMPSSSEGACRGCSEHTV